MRTVTYCTENEETPIVCEGETELEYLTALCNRLGLRPTEVILAENTEGSAPISVVTCAERRAREWGGYDHIMKAELEGKIVALLDQYRVMTLATLRPDGWPQATTVGSVSRA